MSDRVSSDAPAGGQPKEAAEPGQAEEALRRSEERYRALVEAASQAVWSWSPAANTGDFSATHRWWEELTGQSPEEQRANDNGWLNVVHPDDRATAATAWSTSIITGIPYEVEYRVQARTGGWRYIRARGVPIRGPDGQVREWVGTLDDVTGQRAAEEAARLTEARFRQLFEQAPLSIQVLTPDGRTLRVNRAWEELWGLTLEQLADYNVLQDPQLDAKGITPYLRRAAAGEAVTIPAICYDPEETIPGRTSHDNPGRWVSAVAYPLRDAAGRIHEVVLIHQDVTVRHQAEQAIRKSQAWLQTVMDSLPALVSYVDRDLRYRFVNRAYEQWFGIHADEVIGKAVSQILGEEGLQPRKAAIDAVLAGTPVRFEAPTHHRALGTRVTEMTYIPHREEDEVVGFFVHVHDVTDRKRVEQALRENEERLRLAVEIARMGTFELDLATDAVVVNEPGQEIFGWSTTQKTFTEVRSHFHPDEEPEVMERFRAALDPAGPGGLEVEQRIYRTDGALRWLRVHGRASFEGEGAARRATRFLGTYLDVTERREMENALREADRKKDDFIALLAHELRNPLAPIRNGLHVIRLSSDREVRRDAQEMMERQLTHMVRLIDDLLDVSRISRNKMQLRRGRIALTEVINSAVETARPAIQEAGHELTLTLPAAPVYLHADLTRLAQVFGNLLSNSAKYTPRGGRISLTAERQQDEAVITVQDSGIGIPARALPIIFDMFSQVDRSIERSTGGLGIGLALVRGLVEMHGGSVRAESEGEGKGSRFTVRLPILEGAPTPGKQESPIAYHGMRRRVLVVDDNHDGAASTTVMLRLLGHEVRTAFDGVEAVEMAGRFRPEVILMDVGMPRLNGLDATRLIREQHWGKTITIIALTGWGQENDRERSRAAGCDGHLVKPVNLPELQRVLAESISTRSHA